MAKAEDSEKEIWGTLEELLLACAVNRYGTKSWDSVAMEIQNRSSSSRFFLSPQSCKQKYHDLHRRFMAKENKIDEVENDPESVNKKHHKIIPWLEELRKLRVAKLKCEVQRYDVSIVSLQSKVKSLKEERQRSLREEKNNDLNPDLEKKTCEDGKKEGESEPQRFSLVDVVRKPVCGEDCDRENQSFNESNSTDPKSEDQKRSPNDEKPKLEPIQTGAGKPGPVSTGSQGDKPVGERSYNGSSDTIEKESTAPAVDKSSAVIPTREAGDSPEIWESVAESKGGGEEGTTESNVVQSSASLSKKNRRKKEVSGSSSGDEPETDEVSPAMKRISVKSQPLMDFLKVIQSHKYDSIFKRLESQQETQYKSLIRQHIDLESVNTKLKEGRYSSRGHKFFRDLLLLFNNAIVFFSKNSVESIAAIELRELVSKEMAKSIRKLKQPKTPEEPTPPTTIPLPLNPKSNPEEPSDSLLVKPKSSVPMISCRKRSSILTKASTAVVERKVEQKASSVEEKPNEEDDDNDDDNKKPSANIAKEKEKRKRSMSGARSSRSNNKNRNNTNTTKNLNSKLNSNPNPSSEFKGGAAMDDYNSEIKTDKEKKNNNIANVAKRRSVANFLNRMQRNSASNGTLLETLKNSSLNNSNSNEKGVVDQKKKIEGTKDQVSRGSSSGRQAQVQQQQQISSAKRSVGRPPKRASAPVLPPASSKRRRETIEIDVGASSRQPRKRSRR